jgi:hypothetical protein
VAVAVKVLMVVAAATVIPSTSLMEAWSQVANWWHTQYPAHQEVAEQVV